MSDGIRGGFYGTGIIIGSEHLLRADMLQTIKTVST